MINSKVSWMNGLVFELNVLNYQKMKQYEVGQDLFNSAD